MTLGSVGDLVKEPTSKISTVPQSLYLFSLIQIMGSSESKASTGTTGPDPIAGLEGKVFLRDGSEAYTEASYQYATSSYLYDGPLSMQPAAIIYAKNENDVKLVLKYAKAEGVAVAVRTGGHQYSGASSTTGTSFLPSRLNT